MRTRTRLPHVSPFAECATRLVTVLALLFAPGAQAADADHHRTADGLEIYIGIVPAEIVRKYPESSPERKMHGGKPKRGDVHVMVSLFDAASGQRIGDANVFARVAAQGAAGAEKPLEAMTIAGAASYGNYFGIPGKGPFAVELTITRPNVPKRARARFELRYR